MLTEHEYKDVQDHSYFQDVVMPSPKRMSRQNAKLDSKFVCHFRRYLSTQYYIYLLVYCRYITVFLKNQIKLFVKKIRSTHTLKINIKSTLG